MRDRRILMGAAPDRLTRVNELIKRLETVENQYKPSPFWSWNGKLEKEELIRQIRWMRQTNNGGFFIVDKRLEYLSLYLDINFTPCFSRSK